MWNYEKRLQFPVKISKCNPKIAQQIISQYGGPDGEMSASMRYLAQRYSMPVKRVGGLLTDIGTEAPEMFHLSTNTFLPGAQKIRRKQTACRCFCSRVTPFHRQKIQIYINVVLVDDDHFI